MTNINPEIEVDVFDKLKIDAPNGSFEAYLAYVKEIDGERTVVRYVPTEFDRACGQSRVMMAGGRVDFDRNTIDISLSGICQNVDCGCRCRLDLELVG